MMEKFRYKAVNDAERVSGTEQAPSRGAVHLALVEWGIPVGRGNREEERPPVRDHQEDGPRAGSHALLRQLGVFVKAGIPIMEALEVISEETTDKLLKAAILDMIERLQAGDTFAQPPRPTPRRSRTTTSGSWARPS